MKKYEHQRGAILVESAFIVGAIFLMLFGTVYIAIVGFDQMSADGASYEVAHQASVGASAAPNAAAHGVFPNIPQANISTAVQAAPAASISVDYGYNSSVFATNQASINNRHGGVSMMQGTMVVGSANKASARILGMPINVVGSMIEPMWLENGVHFDGANSNGYGSTTPVCAPQPAPSPGVPAPPPRCFQGNIFQTGENTPPYYVGFNYMAHCSGRSLPWGGITAIPNNPATCDDTSSGNSNTQFTPLGVAEFLDLSNWCDASAPASNCTVAPANPGIAGSAPSDSTFATVACHQRVYAKLATFFQNNPNLAQIYANQTINGVAGGPAYYYYERQGTSEGPSNSFGDFEGYDTPPLQQDTISPGAAPYPIDATVREVYHWDGTDISGPPSNADPLYPGQGC